MKTVAVTQRVVVDSETSERYDALDQRWISFLRNCSLIPLVVPNNPYTADEILRDTKWDAVLLTGGNDLCVCGGNAPERDETEFFLLKDAIERKIPLLGVCRGMQVIQQHYRVTLQPIKGHVMPLQTIHVNGTPTTVNSYHRFGAIQTSSSLETWAVALDGVIKAVRHRNLPIQGIMWHPERFKPFRDDDVSLIGDFLRGSLAKV